MADGALATAMLAAEICADAMDQILDLSVPAVPSSPSVGELRNIAALQTFRKEAARAVYKAYRAHVPDQARLTLDRGDDAE